MVWATREAFVNHQKINQNPDKVLSSLLQLFSRRSSLILVNTLQPLEKPDFAPVIPISDEHQVFILFLFLFRIFSQWILKIKVEKLLCTLPNSFLLSTKMPFSLPSFLIRGIRALFFFFNLGFYLAMQQSTWDLGSLTRDKTHAPCSGNAES